MGCRSLSGVGVPQVGTGRAPPLPSARGCQQWLQSQESQILGRVFIGDAAPQAATPEHPLNCHPLPQVSSVGVGELGQVTGDMVGDGQADMEPCGCPHTGGHRVGSGSVSL